MFGGLTKTSSRIAITAAFGLALGGFAFTAGPARAADLGGDCCADLEERVAELEATTVRKGNKKVSVTLSGWVVKSLNVWDDGSETSVIVGDKGYDLGSRFALTGSAQISPGWSAGYNLTVLATGNLFATSGTLAASNQINEVDNYFTQGFNPLYSYIYMKSDTLGTLNWGTLSPASDNPAVLADLSGTVIESNFVFFEGASFLLRPAGGGLAGGTAWEDFLRCQGLGAGIGVDCWGAAFTGVRYDSPTWGGFRFETSWGKNTLTTPNASARTVLFEAEGVEDAVPLTFTSGFVGSTTESNFWDVALFYTADWNSIKLSASYAYTWIESGAITGSEVDLHQVGASIMHKPSGLGIYGIYQYEEPQGKVNAGLLPVVIGEGPPADGNCNEGLNNNCGGVDIDHVAGEVFGAGAGGPFVTRTHPETDAWGIKPFWRKTWGVLGATTIFGEYGEYTDQFAAANNLCLGGGFPGGSAIGDFCGAQIDEFDDDAEDTFAQTGGVFIDSSEVERWGLGVVQEIDSAAMHLWARWQHQELDATFTGYAIDDPEDCFESGEECAVSSEKLKGGFDDWDLFQVGGVIFF